MLKTPYTQASAVDEIEVELAVVGLAEPCELTLPDICEDPVLLLAEALGYPPIHPHNWWLSETPAAPGEVS